MFRIFVTLTVSFLVVHISGCANVMRLESITLTEDDLPMRSIRSFRVIEDSSTVTALLQEWNGFQLTVQYCLFNSPDAAQKAGADGLTWWYVVGTPKFQSESNPENIIGDATWSYIYSDPDAPAHIWLAKNNFLVHVKGSRVPSNPLQFVRDVARKIEAKIEAVLKKINRGVTNV